MSDAGDAAGRGLRKVGVAAWSLLGTLLLLAVIGWVVVQFWIASSSSSAISRL